MAELSKKYPGCIITGSRYIAQDRFSKYPEFKKFLNRMLQRIIKLLFSAKGSDITYLFQSTPAHIIKGHKFLYPKAFVPELALLGKTENLYIIKFPTKIYKRHHSSSHLKFRYHKGS